MGERLPLSRSRRSSCAMVAVLLLAAAAAAVTPASSPTENPDDLPTATAPGASAATAIATTDGAGAADTTPNPWGPLDLLGKQIPAGTRQELSLISGQTFAGISLRTPVIVIRGREPGPTLCITAGVHGDELNGVEIARTVLNGLDPRHVAGTVVGVPIVNIAGFQRSSRYLPDRRDLNRFFPGSARGSSASRIAHAVFSGVIRRCTALVDLHTGSFHRSNLPQVRGDLRIPEVAELARGFGATVIVHHPGPEGTIRRSATDHGIPAIIYEAGEPMRLQADEIRRGVIGIHNVLISYDVLDAPRLDLGAQVVHYDTHWVRVDRGGILVAEVALGDQVREGERLGTITDPIRHQRSVLVSPNDGHVIGMALAPLVQPGFATFHLGLGGEPDFADEEIDEEMDEPEPDDHPMAEDERPE